MSFEKKINLIIWDNFVNFNSPDTQRQLGGESVFLTKNRFASKNEFDVILNEFQDDDYILLCCHVNYTDYSGFLDMRNSNIKEDYKLSDIIYLSSHPSIDVVQGIHTKYAEMVVVKLYNTLLNEIKSGTIKPKKKSEIFGVKDIPVTEKIILELDSKYPQIDIAIITALYKDEFEAIKELIEFKVKDIIKTQTKEYQVGYLKTNKDIKVVAAIPTATGMIDSAIIATQMLELFKPKYLLMSGVCGGRSDLGFGDLVIAQNIVMFQKGKISDIQQKKSDGTFEKIKLYDKNKVNVDYEFLYDENGTKIKISFEKFEIEHDAMIGLDTLLNDGVNRVLEPFKEKMNKVLLEEFEIFEERKKNNPENKEEEPIRDSIDVKLDKIACSTMVINKEGFFEENILPIDRKIAAVEMESFGVARACQFANDGKTKHLIFKSVMDNLSKKDDRAKKFAARISAEFLANLLESGILI